MNCINFVVPMEGELIADTKVAMRAICISAECCPCQKRTRKRLAEG